MLLPYQLENSNATLLGFLHFCMVGAESGVPQLNWSPVRNVWRTTRCTEASERTQLSPRIAIPIV